MITIIHDMQNVKVLCHTGYAYIEYISHTVFETVANNVQTHVRACVRACVALCMDR